MKKLKLDCTYYDVSGRVQGALKITHPAGGEQQITFYGSEADWIELYEFFAVRGYQPVIAISGGLRSPRVVALARLCISCSK